MDLSNIDTRALVNSIPYPAMLLDSQHRILDANSWMVREADRQHACMVACYELYHGRPTPIRDCPIDVAAVSGCIEEKVIDEPGVGPVRVTVSPLMFRSDRGLAVFLHVISPVPQEEAARALAG